MNSFVSVVPFHSANNNNSANVYDNEKTNQQNRDNLSQISGISFNSSDRGGGISQSSSRNNTLERKRFQPEKPLAVPEVRIFCVINKYS